MQTCSKTYSDIPFAHRQPNHDGHCSYIHGHNWSICATFASSKKDSNGFIVDFGKLKYLKQWIDENLDHACVICKNDPILDIGQINKFFKFLLVDDASCEGLSEFIFNEFQKLIHKNENGRVSLTKITLFEDSRNSAEYKK